MNYEYMRAAYLRRLEDEAMFCEEHDEWYMEFCRECEHDLDELKRREKKCLTS